MPTESRMLEQRIQKLESEVLELISRPVDELSRRLRNVGEASHPIRRRINFLRSLLFAEKNETQAIKKWNYMSTRLANLESKFNDWVRSQDPGEGDPGHETSSSCSCTHSCANGGNDEEDSGEEVAVEQADRDLVGEDDWFEAELGLEQYELLAKEEEEEEEDDDDEAGEEKAAELLEKEEKSGQKRRRGRRSLLGAGLGVVLAYVIFHFFGLFDVENSIYPIPT